jgi:hypothetical protein
MPEERHCDKGTGCLFQAYPLHPPGATCPKINKIMLNPKSLDNTEMGYLELKWDGSTLIIFS